SYRTGAALGRKQIVADHEPGRFAFQGENRDLFILLRQGRTEPRRCRYEGKARAGGDADTQLCGAPCGIRQVRFGHGDLLGAEPGTMIERADCQLVGYEHRKESGTWKEPHCEAQVMAAVGVKTQTLFSRGEVASQFR